VWNVLFTGTVASLEERQRNRSTHNLAPPPAGLPRAVNAYADADTDAGIAGNGLCFPLPPAIQFLVLCILVVSTFLISSLGRFGMRMRLVVRGKIYFVRLSLAKAFFFVLRDRSGVFPSRCAFSVLVPFVWGTGRRARAWGAETWCSTEGFGVTGRVCHNAWVNQVDGDRDLWQAVFWIRWKYPESSTKPEMVESLWMMGGVLRGRSGWTAPGEKRLCGTQFSVRACSRGGFNLYLSDILRWCIQALNWLTAQRVVTGALICLKLDPAWFGGRDGGWRAVNC